MFLILFVIAFATLLLLPASVILVYDKYRFTPEGNRRSFLLYILGVIFSFFLAMEAMKVFLQVACPEGSGNLCVFDASLIAQPPALLICMGSYLYLWVRIGKRYARTSVLSGRGDR